MRVRLNIRAQFLLLLVTAMLVSEIVSTGFSLDRIRELDLARSSARFEGESAVLAARANSQFLTLLHDMQMIPHTPPFQGLIRSYHNGGYDEEDSSTSQMWKDRLQTIFSLTLKERPYYMQLRYISDVDEGRELVRVDQDNEGVKIVTGSQLQSKAEEFYYEETLNLDPGEVYLSRITVNREFGQVDEDYIPTLRAIVPIYEADGKRFGLFVINLNIENMLKDVLIEQAPEHDTYIYDALGNVAWYEAAAGEAHFRMAPENHEVQDTIELARETGFRADLSVDSINKGEDLIYNEALEIGNAENSLALTLTEILPSHLVLQEASAAEQQFLLGSVATLGMFLALAVIAAHYFTRPILKLNQGILAWGAGSTDFDLPSDRSDEVGELARSFEGVVTRLGAARKSEQDAYNRISSAINLAVDGLITVSDTGFIQSINPVACEIFATPEQIAVGEPIANFIPAISKHIQADKLETGLLMLTGVASTRREIPVEVSISEIAASDGVFYWVVLRDVTERTLQQKMLQDALGSLRKSNGELNDFAYIASHDLKEPLRGIQIHAQSVLKNIPAGLDSESQRKLGRVNELALRMQKLVTDLLEFSRLNRIESTGQTTDANAAVDETLDNLHSTIQSANAVIELRDELPLVRGESVHVGSIFQNLIVNALKYNDAKIPHISIGLLPLRENEGIIHRNVFYVADNGIGIHTDFHAEVFKIFRRLNNELAYGYGTGAGLTFVRKIIDRYGGTIWLESVPGEGATFYFTLQIVENGKES